MSLKLSGSKISEICRLYSKEDVPVCELGDIFGVDPVTITNYLKRNSIQIKAKKLDIRVGDKFGRWTVIGEAEKRGYRRYFLCECSCSDKTIKEVNISDLKNGKNSSCGCLRKETMKERHSNARINYTGHIFGRLTVLYEVEISKHLHRQVMAQCSCDGNIKRYSLGSLKKRNTTSCGCYNKENHTYQVKDYQGKHPLFCKAEEIRDRTDGLGIEAMCKKCNEWFKPTSGKVSLRIRAIETPMGFEECNFYCSDECKNSCPLFNLRSDPFEIKVVSDNIPTPSELNIWREEVLKRQRDEYSYNFCTINSAHPNDNLRVHHIDPKKIEPIYALDPDNGIVVCVECHDKFHKGECSTGALAYKVCKP